MSFFFLQVQIMYMAFPFNMAFEDKHALDDSEIKVYFVSR